MSVQVERNGTMPLSKNNMHLKLSFKPAFLFLSTTFRFFSPLFLKNQQKPKKVSKPKAVFPPIGPSQDNAFFRESEIRGRLTDILAFLPFAPHEVEEAVRGFLSAEAEARFWRGLLYFLCFCGVGWMFSFWVVFCLFVSVGGRWVKMDGLRFAMFGHFFSSMRKGGKVVEKVEGNYCSADYGPIRPFDVASRCFAGLCAVWQFCQFGAHLDGGAFVLFRTRFQRSVRNRWTSVCPTFEAIITNRHILVCSTKVV